jgi:hypothetical protein
VKETVCINKDQYFEGVRPEVWEFYIGGYKVFEKWLKDRRQRELSYEDISHYDKIVVALGETIQLMKYIDEQRLANKIVLRCIERRLAVRN